MLDAEEMRKIAKAVAPEHFRKAKIEIEKAARDGDFHCLLEIGDDVFWSSTDELIEYLKARGYKATYETRWGDEATHIYVSWSEP